MRHLQWLMREWRGGELALLLVSLVLAVTIVSGITGFADRLHRGIVGESNKFLAADLVLRSPRPVPEAWLDEARELGLAQARILDFRSMAAAGDQLQLAAVKAVSEGYPLKGELRVSAEPFGEVEVASDVPAPGQAWLDSRLFPLLGVSVGDAIGIGDAQLRVSRAVVSEPDRGNSYYAAGARVLMNVADVAGSGVVQAGSLVEYRYLFAGTEEQLASLQQALPLTESHRWQRLDDSQPRIARTLSRAERYLLLAGSFGVALAGVAVALAARRYSQRHYDVVAVMKALGADSAMITRLYGGNLLLLALFSTVAGWLLGVALQSVLFGLIRDLVGFEPPAASWRPVLAAAVTAFICSGAFALPPVLRLRRVAPLRVLRRDLSGEGVSAALSGLIGVGGLTLLMLWYTEDPQLVLAVLVGVLLLIGLAGAVVLQLFAALRHYAARAGGVLRLALAAMYRRRQANAFQVVSLALAMMVLMCLLAMRGSLLEEWRLQLPPDTPNHFLINIAPDEIESVKRWFAERDIETAGLYPMVRGRLVAIDGQALADIPDVDENRGSVDREINLSWAENLPPDNTLVAGKWWDEVQNGDARVSIEQEFAQRLRVEVGDQLTFRIGGLPLDATVSSVRELRWDSMRPNFFLLFEPGALDGYPASAITSFYLPRSDKVLLNDLLRQFPTITLIEMDVVIEQARTVIDQVSAALELVLALIVACALLVGMANIQSSLDSRLHENAILRTLGASRRVIGTGLIAEFAAIGLVAGLLACAGTEASLYLLQTQVLAIEPGWNPLFWLLAPPAGAVLVAISGWWFCRSVVKSPPLYVLRQV